MTPERESELNHPDAFDELSADEQKIVMEWIKENFISRKTPNTEHTSYGLKHIFGHADVGFYMTNGMFKGAMIACGYEPVVADVLNCWYRISKKSPALDYYKG